MYGPVRSCLSCISRLRISPSGLSSETPRPGMRNVVYTTYNNNIMVRSSPMWCAPKANGLMAIIRSSI